MGEEMIKRVARADAEMKRRLHALIDSLNDSDAEDVLPEDWKTTYKLGKIRDQYVVVAETGDRIDVGDIWFCTRCKEVREYFVGQVPCCWECGEPGNHLA